MKRTLCLRPRHAAYALLLIITAACGNDDHDNTPGQSPLPACMLARQVNTASGIPYDGEITVGLNAELTYGYDDASNLVEATSDYKYDYSNGKKSTSRIATTHTYDKDGYRTRTVRQFNATDLDGKATFDATDDTFTYENGRLVKETISTTGDGGNLNYTIQYQYNEAGQLVKTLQGYDNSVAEFEYTGNIVSKITRTDAAGNKTSPLVQYNGAGLLVKLITTADGYTDERRYTYTDEGLTARDEAFENGKPWNATLWEYDNKEHPSGYVNAKPKGYPVIPAARASVVYKRNILKATYLDPSDDGNGWRTRQIDVNDLDYNDKGYPTEIRSRSLNGSGQQLYTMTSTFEYTNCQ